MDDTFEHRVGDAVLTLRRLKPPTHFDLLGAEFWRGVQQVDGLVVELPADRSTDWKDGYALDVYEPKSPPSGASSRFAPRFGALFPADLLPQGMVEGLGLKAGRRGYWAWTSKRPEVGTAEQASAVARELELLKARNLAADRLFDGRRVRLVLSGCWHEEGRSYVFGDNRRRVVPTRTFRLHVDRVELPDLKPLRAEKTVRLENVRLSFPTLSPPGSYVEVGAHGQRGPGFLAKTLREMDFASIERRIVAEMGKFADGGRIADFDSAVVPGRFNCGGEYVFPHHAVWPRGSMFGRFTGHSHRPYAYFRDVPEQRKRTEAEARAALRATQDLYGLKEAAHALRRYVRGGKPLCLASVDPSEYGALYDYAKKRATAVPHWKARVDWFKSSEGGSEHPTHEEAVAVCRWLREECGSQAMIDLVVAWSEGDNVGASVQHVPARLRSHLISHAFDQVKDKQEADRRERERLARPATTEDLEDMKAVVGGIVERVDQHAVQLRGVPELVRHAVKEEMMRRGYSGEGYHLGRHRSRMFKW